MPERKAGSRSSPDFLDFFNWLYLCTFSRPTSLLSLRKYSPLTRPLPKWSRSTHGMPDSRPGLHTAQTYLLIRGTLKAKSDLQANQNPWFMSLRRTGWDLRSSAGWGGGILLGTIPEPKVEETIVTVETTVLGERREGSVKGSGVWRNSQGCWRAEGGPPLHRRCRHPWLWIPWDRTARSDTQLVMPSVSKNGEASQTLPKASGTIQTSP